MSFSPIHCVALAIQKLYFPAIFGLPIATKSTITFNVLIIIMYQLHHVVGHEFLFYLVCLMSISHNFEVKGHCWCTLTFTISKTDVSILIIFFLNVVWVFVFNCCKFYFGTVMGFRRYMAKFDDTYGILLLINRYVCIQIFFTQYHKYVD